MVEDNRLSAEVQSLRHELKLRILFQNILLQGLPIVFTALAVTATLVPSASSVLCLVFQCVMLVAILQWCHHGIRTAQIKTFLDEINPDGTLGLWESWLPQNRPATLLGSRWLVSTKGVFLGLGLVMLVLDMSFSSPVRIGPFVASVLAWITGAIFLFTNPKE